MRSRSLQLAIVSVAYVVIAALRASGANAWGVCLLVGLPFAMALAWAWTRPPPRGEDWIDGAIPSAMRVCFFAASLYVAARSAPAGRPAFDAVANVGAGAASVAALVALSRITPFGGLLRATEATRRFDAAALAAFLWSVAVALPAARALMPSRTVRVDPLAIDAASAVAGAGSLLVTIAAAVRVRIERRLELGVADRANAALAAAAAAFAIALPATLLGLIPPDRALPIGALVSALAVTAACLTREPTRVARGQRILLALMVMAVPTSLFAASLALETPSWGASLVACATLAGVAIGFVARDVARPLGPEQSRWLDAIAAASRAALEPDPEAAVRACLSALREAAGTDAPPPELFRLSPAEVLTVDRAGYLKTGPTAAPPALYELAETEPERTLRAEVLEALEVRRADVRPVLDWLRARGALSATLLSDAEGVMGCLLLPQGSRTTPMTLEEVRALSALADRMAALLGVSSSLARSRARELLHRERADQREDEAIRLSHLLAAGNERHESAARRLARAARVANYSPAARLAADELERLGSMGIPVTLLCPVGIDPEPYAAIAHLASARKTRPFVVVDATDAAEHGLDAWKDPALSPLVLADTGTLLVKNAAALPSETQSFLARALTERRSPSGHPASLDIAIIVSVPATIDALVATGRLSPALADRFGDRAVSLPPLAARAEDLRALIVDRLARLGVRLRGRPLGVDPAALARLIEHAWPGNDLELDDVMVRAVAVLPAPTDVVSVTELDAIGFAAAAHEPRRRSGRPASPAASAAELGRRPRA